MSGSSIDASIDRWLTGMDNKINSKFSTWDNKINHKIDTVLLHPVNTMKFKAKHMLKGQKVKSVGLQKWSVANRRTGQQVGSIKATVGMGSGKHRSGGSSSFTATSAAKGAAAAGAAAGGMGVFARAKQARINKKLKAEALMTSLEPPCVKFEDDKDSIRYYLSTSKGMKAEIESLAKNVSWWRHVVRDGDASIDEQKLAHNRIKDGHAQLMKLMEGQSEVIDELEDALRKFKADSITQAQRVEEAKEKFGRL